MLTLSVLLYLIALVGLTIVVQDLTHFVFQKIVDGTKPYEEQTTVAKFLGRSNYYAGQLLVLAKLAALAGAGVGLIQLGIYLQ